MNSRRLAKEGLAVVDKDLKKAKIGVVYDSVEPPNVSYQEALVILNSQKKWNKLKLGEKLNVLKVYGYAVAGELGIKCPDMGLAKYNDLFLKFYAGGQAISIKNGIVLNIRKIKNPVQAREILAHEIKHIHQIYCMDNECFKPKTMPPEQVVNDWKNNVLINEYGSMKKINPKLDYYDDLTEIDAFDFERIYDKKVFGKYKKGDADTRERREDRRTLLKDMRFWGRHLKDLSPDGKVKKLNELHAKYPYSRDVFDEMREELKKKNPIIQL